MRKLFTKKRVVLVAVAALAVGLATAGYAYFTSTGSGSGSANVGNASSWTVTPATITDTLYPGGSATAADGMVSNGGSAAQQLNEIDATITAPSNTGSDISKPACTAADFELSSTSGWVIDDATHAHLVVNQEVAAGDHYDWSGLSVAMVDRHDTSAGDGLGNQDNCQGATANIGFDAK